MKDLAPHKYKIAPPSLSASKANELLLILHLLLQRTHHLPDIPDPRWPREPTALSITIKESLKNPSPILKLANPTIRNDAHPSKAKRQATVLASMQQQTLQSTLFYMDHLLVAVRSSDIPGDPGSQLPYQEFSVAKIA